MTPGALRGVRVARALALGSSVLLGCGASTLPLDDAGSRSEGSVTDGALADAACTCCPLTACCYATQPPPGTQCLTMATSPGQPPGQGTILVSSGATRYCASGTGNCPVAGPLPPPELAA